MSERTLGEALTDEFTVDGGKATIHQGGIVLRGVDLTATAWWGLLGIGRPVMVSGDPVSAQVMILEVDVAGPGVALEVIATLLRSAMEGRVVLGPTATSGERVDLMVGTAEAAGDGVVVPVTAPAMSERVLYDVVVKDGPTIAPHAVYFKREWRSFGLAHVTDTHVARRIDQFRTLLEEAGRPAGAHRLVSFNDRFRGFVKYANRLHDQGLLDLIVVTGDLYDYLREVIYEDAAGTPTAPAPNSNPELLRDLILGRSDAPGFSDVEELRVPIFLIPGNHDYRNRAYHLILDIQDPAVGDIDVQRVPHQASYDLTVAEAAILTNRLYPERVRNPVTGEMIPAEVIQTADTEVPNVSPSAASDMIAVDESLGDYHRYLGDPTSHTVVLGDHRIVLFDSGPDTGRVESVRAFLAHRIGLLGGEDEATFLGGSPNCEGPTEQDVDEVARVLAEVPPHGLVIVASHAPVFNVWDTAYPYFLRESQRRHQQEQVSTFLLGLTPYLERQAPVSEKHPTWFGVDGSAEVDFVKRGNYDDRLDFGVSRGDAKRLLHVLVGVDLPRAADLVLTGHTHRDNECVVRRLPGGEPAVFHDYYTENPGTFYPSTFATTLGINGAFSRTWVQVQDGADPAGTPTATPGHDYTHELVVPPYADPLNGSADPVAWWDTHRPLVMQTAALGPLSGVREFAGFRVVEVADNVIRRISRVPIERLERSGWTLDWESARAPIPAMPAPEAPWLTVSEGATLPGARVSGVAVKDRVALFLADPNGGVYAASGTVANWSPWRPVSEGVTVPGGTVTACVADEQVTLVVSDPNGGVYACRGRDTDWSGWVNVRQGATAPGAPVSAVPGPDGRISLFLADPNGGVYTCRGVGDEWDPWSPVSQGSSTPGAPITAVADADGRISLFLADPNGGVYTCEGFGTDWGGWSDVRQGSTVPGGHVTAIRGADQLVSLFLADPNGGIYTSRGSGTSWSNWAPVAQGSTTPGASVSVFGAATVAPGHLAVVVADAGGGIYSITGLESEWGMWTPVAEGLTRPGSPVTAVQVPGSSKITILAMADAQGGVFAKRTTL